MPHILHDQTCTRCPVLVNSRVRIVHGMGAPNAQVVFVGEAPGRHGADQSGIPFWGDKSGRILHQVLVDLGLAAPDDPHSRRCFVTNLVRCCPPQNRTPLPSEIAACTPFLHAELSALHPRIIVPVGRLALRSVGERYLGRDPGPIRALHALPLHADTCVILPMIHPARIARAQLTAFVVALRELLS